MKRKIGHSVLALLLALVVALMELLPMNILSAHAETVVGTCDISNLKKIAAVEASCTQAGTIAHWLCEECGSCFADADHDVQISFADTCIAPIPHTETCGCTKEDVNFEYDPDFGKNQRQDGTRCLILVQYDNEYYAMGNITYEDGSRNAVKVTVNTDGTVTASSYEAEFLTFSWGENEGVYLADGAIMSFDDGKIVAYDINRCLETSFVPDPCKYTDDYYYYAYMYASGSLSQYNQYLSFNYDSEDPRFEVSTQRTDNTKMYREVCTHEGVKHIEKVKATCTKAGTVEHWLCEKCGTCFADAECKTQISFADTCIASVSHTDQCGCINETVEFVYENGFYKNQSRDGIRCLILGKYDNQLYAMGNITYEDGSRNAIKVNVNENGTIEVSSEVAEILTFYWSEKNGGNYLVNGDILSLDNGKIVLYDSTRCLENPFVPNAGRFLGNQWGNLFAYNELSKESAYLSFNCNPEDPRFIVYYKDYAYPTVYDDSTIICREVCSHESVRKITGVEPSCTELGNVEHWCCTDCGTCFTDEKHSKQISFADTCIETIPHTSDCGHIEETRFEYEEDFGKDQSWDGIRCLILGKSGEQFYAMGNTINADGSRNAVKVTIDKNGKLIASSSEAEFLTFSWSEDFGGMYFADGGILSLDAGRIVVYDNDRWIENSLMIDAGRFEKKYWKEEDMAYWGNIYVSGGLNEDAQYLIFDTDAEVPCFRVSAEDDSSMIIYREVCKHKNIKQPVPTCTEQGIEELWYCEECGNYYENDNFEQPVYPMMEQTLPALGHSYNAAGVCERCGIKRLIYSQISTLEEFDALCEHAYYLWIIKDKEAKKTYAAALPILNNPYKWTDDNNNKIADALEIDENGNEIPDLIEDYDAEADGIPDHQQDQNGDNMVDDSDWMFILSQLEMEYNQNHDNFVEVTMEEDGRIILADEGAMEMQMMLEGSLLNDKENFTYDGVLETDRLRAVWVPNYWVASNGEMGYFGEEHFWVMERTYRDFETSETMGYCNWKISFNANKTVRLVPQGSYDDTVALQFIKYENSEGNPDMTIVSLPNYLWESEEENTGEDIGEYIIMQHKSATLPIYLYAAEPWGEWTPDADGNTHTRQCECGKIETKEHSYDEGVVTLEATHTEPGIKIYTCADCGYYYEEQIPVTSEHMWSEWEADADGKMHFRTCECDAVDTEEHKYGEGIILKEATHTTTGEKQFTCTICEYSYTEEIPVTPDHEWGDWKENTDATHIRSCACGETDTAQHNLDEGVVTKEATHTVTGAKKYTCSDCGYYYFEKIPVTTDHEWGQWKVNASDDTTHIHYCACGEEETAQHHFDTGVVTLEATHTEPGIKTYTCADCGYYYEEQIPVTSEHMWSEWEADADGKMHFRTCECDAVDTEEHKYGEGIILKEATHTTTGEKQFTCTICEYSYTEEIPVTLEHEWSDWKESTDTMHIRSCVCGETDTAQHNFDEGVVTKEATHTVTGAKKYTCADCEYYYFEEISVTTDHEWGQWKVNASDDTTHIHYCACGEEETAQHNYDTGVVTKQPTHTTTGMKKYTCNDCGYYYEEAVPITAEHTWGDWQINKAEDVTHIRYCVCGEEETAKHNFDTGVVTEEPTHTTVGREAYTCKDCGYIHEEVIPTTSEHIWSEWQINKAEDVTHIRYCVCGEEETEKHNFDTGVVTEEPTHTTVGREAYTCKDCGYVHEEVIPTTSEHTWSEWNANADGKMHSRTCECGAADTKDHTYTEGIVVKEATHTEEGIREFTCIDCEHSYTEVIPVTSEHTWGDWQINKAEDVTHIRYCVCGKEETAQHNFDTGVVTKQPTHTTVGREAYTCKDCGYVHEEVIPTTSEHTWSDWTADADGKTHNRICECGAAEMSEHIYAEGIVIKEPTHTETGEKQFTCTTCEHSYIEEIPVTPDHEWGDWKESTDTMHIRSCVCGETDTAQHNFNEGVVTKEATHTVTGVKVYTCKDCGHIKEEMIPTTSEHTWRDWAANADGKTHSRICECGAAETSEHIYAEGIVTKEPTHTVAGEKQFTCTICKHSYMEEIPVTSDHEWGAWKESTDTMHIRSCACGETDTAQHNFDEGVVTKEAMHTVTGVKVYTCKDCGYIKEEMIPTTSEHTWSDWAADADGKTHSRTCECGAAEMSEHIYAEGIVTKEPTHTAAGEKQFTCTICEHFYMEEIPVTPDHEWGDWEESTDTMHIRSCACGETDTAQHNLDEGVITKEATHTVTGAKKYTCSDCEYSYTEEIPTTPEHEWSEWITADDVSHMRSCICGIQESASHNFGEGVLNIAPSDSSFGVKEFTCAICNGVHEEPVQGAIVKFAGCTGLDEDELVFIKETEDTYTFQLPSENDIAAKEGYAFVGWKASFDGVTYMEDSQLIANYNNGTQLTFTAEWAKVVDAGSMELSPEEGYVIEAQEFEIEGDPTVYFGKQPFYVPEKKVYVIKINK